MNRRLLLSTFSKIKTDPSFKEDTVRFLETNLRTSKSNTSARVKAREVNMNLRRVIVWVCAVLLFSASITLAIILSGKQPETKPQSALAGSTSEQPTESTEASQNLTIVYNDDHPGTFASIDDLLLKSEYVFIGTVSSVSPAVRINRAEYNLRVEDGFEYSNITTSYFVVEEVISGDLQVGDSFQVDQFGGVAEGVNDVWENVTYPAQGNKYLVFALPKAEHGGEKHFENMFTGAFDGFYEIDGSTLIPQDERSFFNEGESLENALASINAAKEMPYYK